MNIREMRQRGASKLTVLVFGTILLVVGYSLYNIVPFFYDYFEMSNQMSAIIAVAGELKDDVVRKRLGKHMSDLGLPALPADIKIDRRDHYMRLSLSYEEVFSIELRGKTYDIYKFPFTAEAEGAY